MVAGCCGPFGVARTEPGARLTNPVYARQGDAIDVLTEDDVRGTRRLDDEPISPRSARREFISLLHSGRPPTIKDVGVRSTTSRDRRVVATGLDVAGLGSDGA